MKVTRQPRTILFGSKTARAIFPAKAPLQGIALALPYLKYPLIPLPRTVLLQQMIYWTTA